MPEAIFFRGHGEVIQKRGQVRTLTKAAVNDPFLSTLGPTHAKSAIPWRDSGS
jgi:hypothetical protein